MPKQDVCQTCPDFVPFGNECSDAGDCWRGFCACDTGYTGYKCQESRKFIFKALQAPPRGPQLSIDAHNLGPGGAFLELEGAEHT